MGMEFGRGRRIRVLIIDDSALVRALLTRILDADPQLQVVGAAADAFVARDKIKALRPDVLTLDVQMPRMDGLQFLRNLMRLRPMPVVMCSSLTDRGADVTLAALELGAVDFIAKPRVDVAHQLEQYAAELIEKIKTAAGARVRPLAAARAAAVDAPLPALPLPAGGAHDRVVAIGASTGGTEALKELLTALPADFPGIIVVQHMPETFTGAFAKRLDSMCRIHVAEARDGDRILPGHALLAPGGHQMAVVRRGAEYHVRVYRGERVNRHIPSVDVLFGSCAQQLGRNAFGVLLTGMGNDGAQGMLRMKQADSYTIAQDEATSVVFGMPKEAIRLGGVDEILPLPRIAGALVEHLGQRSREGE